MVFNCVHGQEPAYLVELCQPGAGVDQGSISDPPPVVPRHQLSYYGRRAFCVAGPSVWNSLPNSSRDPIIGGRRELQSLRTISVRNVLMHFSVLEVSRYNRLFTYSLTYLVQMQPQWLKRYHTLQS